MFAKFLKILTIDSPKDKLVPTHHCCEDEADIFNLTDRLIVHRSQQPQERYPD